MATTQRLRDGHPPVRQACAGDLPALRELLSLCGLPFDGVVGNPDAFLVAFDQGLLTGSVGLEPNGADGLLRTLAVRPDHRGRGLGAHLTSRALQEARRLGLRRVFLLTETASEYFPRFEFRPVSRQEAPSAVQASVEFASACPETAICMERRLA